MEIATTISRIMLGFILIGVPVNAYLNKAFKPKMPVKAQRLMDAFRETGYLLSFIYGTELLIGLLLVSGYGTPLALLGLLPITLNILLFHLVLAPPVGPGLVIFLLHAFLLWAHRAAYLPLLNF